jgi:hypothetical protein
MNSTITNNTPPPEVSTPLATETGSATTPTLAAPVCCSGLFGPTRVSWILLPPSPEGHPGQADRTGEQQCQRRRFGHNSRRPCYAEGNLREAKTDSSCASSDTQPDEPGVRIGKVEDLHHVYITISIVDRGEHSREEGR